jgi:CheY-like chemotaxis protein
MSKLVLVADDERDIVEIVREVLEDAGFETMEAYDGQQALEAIAQKRPDALVLDIKMPVVDGIEVIKRLRADPSLSGLPVVVLTSTQVIHESREQFRELGVKSWLSKPFEPIDLVAAVKKALGET